VSLRRSRACLEPVLRLDPGNLGRDPDRLVRRDLDVHQPPQDRGRFQNLLSRRRI
jgi:hypothetical protein